MRQKLILIGASAFALLLVVVLYRGFGTDPHAVPFHMAGRQAPPFKMKRLDNGQEVSFASLAGKPVVINFWATWCGPCKLEHPVLQWGAQKYAGRAEFVGIVFEDTEENTRQFLKENGGVFPQLFDPKSTTAVDYGVSGVPETYFINKQGVIVGKYANPIDPGTLDRRLAEIL